MIEDRVGNVPLFHSVLAVQLHRLQIKVPLDPPEDVVRDVPLIAQAHYGTPLGVKQLAPQAPGCFDPFLFAIEVRALIVGPVVVRFFLVTAAVGLCLVGIYPVFRGQLFEPAQSRKDDMTTSKTLPA